MSNRDTQTPSEVMHAIWLECARSFALYLDTTQPEQRTAAMMSVIRKFLKDNHCAIDASHKRGMRAQLEQLTDYNVPFKP